MSRVNERLARMVLYSLMVALSADACRRLRFLGIGAIAQATDEAHRRGRRIGFRALWRATWKEIRPVVTSRSSWDWKAFFRRLVDIPLSAALFAVPVGLCVVVSVSLVTLSLGAAVGVGAVAGSVLLFARAVRIVRARCRILFDREYQPPARRPQSRLLTAPNLISWARVMPGAPLVGRLITDGDIGGAVVVLAVLTGTDFADGFIARRFKADTAFGARLDAFADRCVRIATAGMLVQSAVSLPAIVELPLVAMAARDLLGIVGGAIRLAVGRGIPESNLSGRVSSVTGAAGLLTALGAASVERLDQAAVAYPLSVLLCVSLAFGIFSYVSYALDRDERATRRRPAYPNAAYPEFGFDDHMGVLDRLDSLPFGEPLHDLYLDLLKDAGDRAMYPLQLLGEAIAACESAEERAGSELERERWRERLYNLRELYALIDV